jgi:hypothetical protein
MVELEFKTMYMSDQVPFHSTMFVKQGRGKEYVGTRGDSRNNVT